MPRRSEDGRWDSKFGRFIKSYGVQLLATRVRVDVDAVYQWVNGTTRPNPKNAFLIQRLARRRRIAISLEEIYQHHRGFKPKHKPARN